MAKKQAKTKQVAAANYHDIDEDYFDRRKSPEFEAFEDLIESVLTDTPQTIGEIRRAAKTSNYKWLGEALDSLVSDGRAKLIRGFLDKYISDDRTIVPLAKVSKEAYHGNFLCK